jgi:hypothetical protein
MLVGPAGVGLASLRLEVIVGGDKCRLSFTCLATRSEGSCVDLPRLYETVVQVGQGGGWERDMVGGWAGRLPARDWDKGSRIGVVVSRVGHTRRNTHFGKLTH